ncbi:Receptor activity-modifying protein 2 [Microtus ochrogaster]|uniref:Receptor activity-modifying protein 2 n=1 Tax=Microtus ochrogaster TaxID=79684 RepID=A0A8J6H0F6_MICOH|nr:Receptor activity-modifying protein 2 [Microtus ochrogaster]
MPGARVGDEGGPGGEGAWTTKASTGPPAVSTSPEFLNQSLLTEDSLLSKGNVEESFEMYVLRCWFLYNSHMVSVKYWCNWTLISRHYSDLQYCLEHRADQFGLGFPNPLAEMLILETHLIDFANPSLVQPAFSDPPRMYS